MVERRWLVRLVPPVAGLLVAGVLATSSIGAASPAWQPPPCSSDPVAVGEAAVRPVPTEPAALGDEAWFTLDPVLDGAGALAGQRLRVGDGAGRRAVELPPEAWASGPWGSLVLVVADDGRRSTIAGIDVAAGCAWPLGTDASVVRRAVLDPAGSSVYEFRVDRRSRADLGVWRRPLDGSPPRRVLAPFGPDADVGLVFATTLAWSAEGDRLAVQSCGAVRCRTRMVDPLGGAVAVVPGSDQGELVGLAAGRAIHYGACLGLPCPLLATDVADGTTVMLDEAASLARLVATADGPRVVAEPPGGGRLHIVDLDGNLDRVVPVDAAGLRLMPPPDRAAAGTRLPPGWVVLSPDGRSPDGAVLASLADGSTLELPEVTR
jgi:hypothetical protein